MLDLCDEFAALIGALEAAGAEYAVCGGLAMAIHGLPRATVGVDLVVPPSAAQRVLACARGLGYTIPAEPMSFAGGAVEIRRVTKIDAASGDLLGLDLLLVTPAIARVWRERTRVRWERGELWVVSRQGLTSLNGCRRLDEARLAAGLQRVRDNLGRGKDLLFASHISFAEHEGAANHRRLHDSGTGGRDRCGRLPEDPGRLLLDVFAGCRQPRQGVDRQLQQRRHVHHSDRRLVAGSLCAIGGRHDGNVGSRIVEVTAASRDRL
jgi:hypothetical protein